MKYIKIIPTFFPISADFAVVNYISLGSKARQKMASNYRCTVYPHLSTSADLWSFHTEKEMYSLVCGARAAPLSSQRYNTYSAHHRHHHRLHQVGPLSRQPEEAGGSRKEVPDEAA